MRQKNETFDRFVYARVIPVKKVYIYVATDLIEGEACADEGEFISTEKFHHELVKMIINNEITDAKTVAGILLAEKIIKGEIEI